MSTPEELQALGKALEAAKDYADAVLKGPFSELGGILSDTIGYWRLKNRIRLMLKTKQWLQEKGVEPKKVMPDIFVPLLEDGGNVEDETLSEMFASLLAGHLDPGRQKLAHPSYTKVLAQLAPLDAKIMVVFRSSISHKAREVGSRGAPSLVGTIAREMGMPDGLAYLACLNLQRLGILSHYGHSSPVGHPYPALFDDRLEHQLYRITEYGIAFCDACHYESIAESEVAAAPTSRPWPILQAVRVKGDRQQVRSFIDLLGENGVKISGYSFAQEIGYIEFTGKFLGEENVMALASSQSVGLEYYRVKDSRRGA